MEAFDELQPKASTLAYPYTPITAKRGRRKQHVLGTSCPNCTPVPGHEPNCRCMGKCGLLRTLSDFYSTRNGHDKKCIECRSNADAERRNTITRITLDLGIDGKIDLSTYIEQEVERRLKLRVQSVEAQLRRIADIAGAK